jgi:hypothetical protein
MKTVEFKPPAGLSLPEGTKPGDSVELMAEFCLKPNGNLCLTSIEDNAMPGYEKADEKEKEPERKPNGAMDEYMASRRESEM